MKRSRSDDTNKPLSSAEGAPKCPSGPQDQGTTTSVAPMVVLQQFHKRLQTAQEKGEAALYRQIAEETAEYLMNGVVIRAKDPKSGSTTLLGVLECELYANAAAVHEDHYTHGDEQQQQVGTFYFHKRGGTYKGGSFKGMDITFGGPTMKCGMLIRSLYRMDPIVAPGNARDTSASSYELFPRKFDKKVSHDPEVVEGPSLVVDLLLKLTGSDKIISLVGDKPCLKVDDEDGLLCLLPRLSALVGVTSPPVTTETPPAPVKWLPFTNIIKSPRVGLVPRTVKDLQWAGKLYRFIGAYDHNTQEGRGVYKIAKSRPGVAAAIIAAAIRDEKDLKKMLEDRANAVTIGTGVSGSTLVTAQNIVTRISSSDGKDVEADAVKGTDGVFAGDVGTLDIISRVLGHALLHGNL